MFCGSKTIKESEKRTFLHLVLLSTIFDPYLYCPGSKSVGDEIEFFLFHDTLLRSQGLLACRKEKWTVVGD